MDEAHKPSVIYGGCLCEQLRYRITFAPDHDFTKSGTTCQCSQCRKQTGTLFMHTHSLRPSQWEWLAPFSTGTEASGDKAPGRPFTELPGPPHKAYQASPQTNPNYTRGICTNCGSLLYWRDSQEDEVDVMVGTIDKEWLRRHGRWLTDVPRHLWCEDEIEGVTDHLKGERRRLGTESELMPDR